MTATTTMRRIESVGGSTLTQRHGITKVLRGAAWKRGWLLCGHALTGTGDRLMPYPDLGFNSAVTAANGGPLQYAGADANGGLRVISRKPNVFFRVQNGAALAVTVVTTSTGQLVQVTAILASSTAAAIVAAVRGHAQAHELIQIAATGTGAGLSADAGSSQTVPYVRLVGLAGGEADNSADSSNDATIVLGTAVEQVYFGRTRMLLDQSNCTLVAPQRVWALDNQTVVTYESPLCLPLWCSSYEDDAAVCEVK